jgi:hypothetical protein
MAMIENLRVLQRDRVKCPGGAVARDAEER